MSHLELFLSRGTFSGVNWTAEKVQEAQALLSQPEDDSVVRIQLHRKPVIELIGCTFASRECFQSLLRLLASHNIQSLRICGTWRRRLSMPLSYWSDLVEIFPPASLRQLDISDGNDSDNYGDDATADNDPDLRNYKAVEGIVKIPKKSLAVSLPHDHCQGLLQAFKRGLQKEGPNVEEISVAVGDNEQPDHLTLYTQAIVETNICHNVYFRPTNPDASLLPYLTNLIGACTQMKTLNLSSPFMLRPVENNRPPRRQDHHSQYMERFLHAMQENTNL